ncbi:hypothetical protein [Phenylobacterium sp.]|uniref:hypothetical protein n=1 Tax=Phenylobacterium sp. TaxID=1871053 RepID=UPI002DE234B1|nr:hypothetical protein [Phenylobacterium sp.]
MDNVYTLVGLRADGVAPVVDIRPASEADGGLRAGAAFLAEHASCSKVEIWLDGQILTTLSRSAEPAGEGL